MNDKERKAKVADIKSRADELAKKMQDHSTRVNFNRQLLKEDPDAAAAAAKFRVLKRRGQSAEEIKQQMTPKQKAAFVRSVDAAKAFSRRSLD